MSAFVFVADRIPKIAAMAHLTEGQTISVIPGIFQLTRVNNTGAAFGLLSGRVDVLAIFSVISVLLLGIMLTRSVVPLRRWALSLVLGGALGNLFDRLRYGYVIDFLDFRVWPVFNVADAAICVGVGVCILSFFSSSR